FRWCCRRATEGCSKRGFARPCWEKAPISTRVGHANPVVVHFAWLRDALDGAATQAMERRHGARARPARCRGTAAPTRGLPRQGGAGEFLGHLVRALPRGNAFDEPAARVACRAA